MLIIRTILFLLILGIVVFSLIKFKNPNDNNIIKKIVINILTFILFFVVYYFVICFISMIPLYMMSNNSGSDSGLWAYAIILGMGLAPILSLITTIRLNRKKENSTITNHQNSVESNNTPIIKQKFNSENWFCLILFIILNISFSPIVTTESVAKSLIFILYPFIVLYIPIILLIILNIKKKKQNLFKVYLTCALLIIIVPFILNAILSSLDLRDWTLIIKLLLSICSIIYIIFKIFQKNIDVSDNNIEIRQNNFNNIVETNTTISKKNNPYKIIALIFYNCIIVYLILTTDFSDWGGLIMGPIVSLMIFIGNPLLTWLLFRKNNNKGKIIFISFISTIILTYVASFFGNPDNINNLIENNKEDKEIKSILNDTNNNIEIYSNDEFKLLINIDKECLYKIDKTKGNGGDANVIIQRNYKLLTIDLVQKLIDENTFNEYLLFTKNINNENANVTMNIKYKTIDNKEDNQGVFRVNDKYYIFENDGREWIFDDILKENNILQEKIFSIIENIDYLPYKTEYKYDFYADETFDYLILYNEVKDKFMYYQTYKCDFENKSNSERLKEFFNFRKYSSKSFNTGEYNEYIINNGKIEKIIIYEFGGNQVWIEIFPSNFKNSLFIEVFAFTNKEKRIIKDSVSSQKGSYDISEENIQMLNIELINGGVKVNGILDNNKNYGWVIKRDDEIVLKRVAKNAELIFERDLTKKEFYDIPGKYEIYLDTYNKDLGYIKISNSVFWNK